MDAGIAGALKYGALGLSALLALWTAALLTIELKKRDGFKQGAHRLIKMFMFYSIALLCVAVSFLVYEKWLIDRKDERLAAKDEKLAIIRSEVSAMNTDVLYKSAYVLKNQTRMGKSYAEDLANFSDSLCQHTNRIATVVEAPKPIRPCDHREQLGP